MHKRLYIFFEHGNILYESQYGFREKHSTSQAVLEFITDTIEALENRKSTLGIFLDLSKAFDTINHNILLRKLYYYGIRGIAFDWVKSYLSNRSQYVQYQNCNSVHMPIVCGVPQGSVLGPLLFLIYMNDLPNCLESKSVLFADDTSLYKSSVNIKDLYCKMNIELNKLSDWFKANKLSLNVAKSNYILISNVHDRARHVHLLKVNNIIIERTRCVKFLGMHIDECLTWNDHIKICRAKIASSIYAINRMKHIIPKEYMRTLYFSIVYPYLSYGIPIWGGTYNIHKNKMITIQKRAVRVLSNAKYNAHTDPLFRELKILKLADIYRVEILKIVVRHLNNNLPEPISKLFILNSEICLRRTRQILDLYVAKCRTTLATQHIVYKGPKFWNLLPAEMKDWRSMSLKSFSSKLIKYIFEQYSD